MKLLKTKEPYLTKEQTEKVCLAFSIMTISLYVVAMVFSLLGSSYFILKYQNPQMDSIESFLNSYNLYSILMWLYSTIEFYIISSFILKHRPKWYYVLIFFSVPLILYYSLGGLPDIVQTLIPFIFYLGMPIIENKKFKWTPILRLLIASVVTFTLQAMIYVIKSGGFSIAYIKTNMSAHFIYTLEYYIALLVILFTISLYINREKGDSICTVHGGFSQTLKKNSQISLPSKVLTKLQKRKLVLLYTKIYLTQILGFLLLMVLPFITGKVFEFLVMYFSFAIVRNILGFNYSLHYKKESLCITVGVIVFGTLTLAVPFFYILVILAITLGIGLAVLLHLSYKYKGMWLFNKVAKPDKLATLYVYFEGNLTEPYVRKMCKYRGLENLETDLIFEFTQGEKLSYLAYKYHYSQRSIIYKIDEAIDKLVN